MLEQLDATIRIMSEEGRGILAADESFPTIAKRFATIDVESTEEARRSYREMLFTTPGLNEFVSGVIMFEETLGQKTKDGVLFPEYLSQQNIVPGIKVDKGLVPLANSDEEKVTQGLDGLPERLAQYKEMGARFAKWRAVFNIDELRPSEIAVISNAENLARYAAICQNFGIVPIVEPELLIDGEHDIDDCEVATEEVLHTVFHLLHKHQVILEGMVLKPSMVISGKFCPEQADIEEVAERTVSVLLRTVPAAVQSINFLSGGQSAELATQHLNAMNELGVLPWNLSFSYGRALQDPALKTWAGKQENVQAAQQALYKRAKLNSAAAIGEYSSNLEEAA